MLKKTNKKSRKLIYLEKQLANDRKEAVDRFWKEIEEQGTPLIEKIEDEPHNDLVTFIYRTNRNHTNVTLLLLFHLGLSNIGDHDMEKIQGTDIWYSSYIVRNDLRFRYEFSPDDPHDNDWKSRRERAKGDIYNRNMLEFKGETPEENKTFSYVVMSRAKEHIWVQERSDNPKGALKEYLFTSPGLETGRKIHVYTPPGYKAEEREYGFLVLNDGEDYINVLSTVSVLDNLIYEGKISPLIAVFIESSENRIKELCCDDQFSGIIADEFVPWLREMYPLSLNPEMNIIGGLSAGGLFASYMGLKHSDIFGNVLSQSGYFCYDPDEKWSEGDPCLMGVQFAEVDKLPLKFYLNVGILESSRMIDANSNMRDVLISLGYHVDFEEFQSGHDHLNWDETLATGLISLIGLTS